MICNAQKGTKFASSHVASRAHQLDFRRKSEKGQPGSLSSFNPTDKIGDFLVIKHTDTEIQEWMDSILAVTQIQGKERSQEILTRLNDYASLLQVRTNAVHTPYTNTFADDLEYPGDETIEERIENILRWNAMAMVVRANKASDGIGGHISTYASSATIYETLFHHFFQGKDNIDGPSDIIYFQGHGSPGMYARGYLEGRFTETHLNNFRRELAQGGGLSSYPHPYLMPDYWEFPTVSMGLGPITAIYQARFNKYLENRGLISTSQSRVWAFLGDGETGEPETLGALNVAANEGLDNLTFVLNCNLQRLDGPVRGNGQIVQELEGVFKGAGWNVIKVLWGRNWDPLLQSPQGHKLVEKLGGLVDGEYQKLSVEDGAYARKHLFDTDPDLQTLAAGFSDAQIGGLTRGGHDRVKLYTAYKHATEHKGQPSLILAKTVKGFGLGSSGAGQNSTHQKKKLDDQTIRELRDQWDIPVQDKDLKSIPFYKPDPNSPEIRYMLDHRKKLGGFVPSRRTITPKLSAPAPSLYDEFYEGTGERSVSTTMVLVRVMSKLLKDKNINQRIVPIVPDEARTFGMEAFFGQIGIYSPKGQLYEPVDKKSLLYYKESKKGQLLEEGISEAGAMSSFIAAGTSHTTSNFPMIPFYLYYSMFGLQRIGDLAWSAADQGCRGFLVGATAGRTTLAGEGLQHQDGNSHLLAYPIPTLKAYDPTFAFEIATLIKHGIEEMYVQGKDVFYYITVENENYPQPIMPAHVSQEDIIKGLYLYKPAKGAKAHAHILSNGSIMNEALYAQDILENNYNIPTNVYSAISFKALQDDINDTERHNLYHPDQPQQSHVEKILGKEKGIFVAATDYVKTLPNSISKAIPGTLLSLGTDGFGRSEAREDLRQFFEVDRNFIAFATISKLFAQGDIEKHVFEQAKKDLHIDSSKPNPRES
ncbi:MAG: pyruvate dehydrogenase (acetyl-transferring), homodimeric type [Deltaproteobacteria bacterium]|nr:pyruvate dehydrogenase (acetyl-transferring), homodimeric type [Deltaproteobacteria bacterium]